MELAILGLSKTYGKKQALRSVSLEFQAGLYGILGPNGAGKSTLMELITDNITRTEGEICYNQKEILQLGAAFRREVGYMPQQQEFCNRMKAREFLYYIGQLKGIKRKKLREESEYLLEMVHLSDVADRYIGTFSGGMKQRILLAQALLGSPRILLLDEPTAGLDPKERIYIRNRVADLAQDKIVLFVTHVVSDIEAIADEIVLMNGGTVLARGTVDELTGKLEGKVGNDFCGEEEISELAKKYKIISSAKKRGRTQVRFIGEDIPQDRQVGKDNITLEDVYMFYFDENAV